MAGPRLSRAGTSEADEAVATILDSAARFLLWAGGAATVISLCFLVYTFFMFAGGGSEGAAQAQSNIQLFGKVLPFATLAFCVGAAVVFWGEETLGAIMLLAAVAIFAMPFYLPGLGGIQSPSQLALSALIPTRLAGLIAGVVSLVIIGSELAVRFQLRAREGSKSDQIKYGKGIKEDRDFRNVFMGKCWQLPYCRKFVRERCPIYHSRRTCWKERVGCMCEESVIRNAMEGKVIPSDIVAAAKYIPYNSKLSPEQKAERCRQCVIYNEHQKHKYKLMMPVSILGVAALYYLGRVPIGQWLKGFVGQADKVVGTATYRGSDAATSATKTLDTFPYHEVLTVCLMLIIFAYMMRLLEYLIFKLKV